MGLPSAAPASGSKARRRGPKLTHMMVLVVMVSMTALVFYMHQIISTLHQDQEALRLGLHDLTTSEQISLLAEGRVHASFAPPLDKASRKLGGMFKTGTVAGSSVGCWVITAPTSANQIVELDVSGYNCGSGSEACPDCFITDNALAFDFVFKLTNCGLAKWTGFNAGMQTRQGIWVYTFINMHSGANKVMTVYDGAGSAGRTDFKVPANAFVQAWCSEISGGNALFGTNSRLIFQSLSLPTLTVNDGLTVSSGNFVMSGTGTFSTGSGAVTLNGPTQLSGSNTFTTGTGDVTLAGDVSMSQKLTVTGVTQLDADLTLGTPSTEADLTVYGDIQQNDIGGSKTFTTGSGALSLNGNVDIAVNKYLHMAPTGSGTFKTGNGQVTFYGDTVVDGSNTFTTGTGAVSLLGNTVVGSSGTSRTFTVTGASTFNSDLDVGSPSTQADLALYGDFTQYGTSTFKTGTGAITMSGHVGIASGKNVIMDSSGAGIFSTGSGAVSLRGNTRITGSNTFETGTGAITFKGPTTIATGNTFTVEGGTVDLKGDVNIGLVTTPAKLTHYGDYEQAPATSTPSTWKVGAEEVTFNTGTITVAAGSDLIMDPTGAGVFTTGTGAISLAGDVTVAQGKKLILYQTEVNCGSTPGTAATCDAVR